MAVWDHLDFLARRFRADNPNRTLVHLPVDGGKGKPAKEGDVYFRVWVRRMFLALERDWFHGQYPSIQSFITFNFGGNNKPVVVASAAGPSKLASVDKDHLNRVISINHLLCELVPFVGGSVKIEAGLIAVKIDDDVERFMNVVGTFSELVTVPQLSLALDVTEKVAAGVKALAGVKDNKLVAGFVGAFVGDDGDGGDDDFTLRPSQFLVADVPASHTQSSFEFRDGQLLYQGKPFTGVNWMLLEIELVRKRGNPIGTIPSIGEPLKKAREALQNGRSRTAADALVRAAVVAALNSNDLIERDRNAVALEVKRRYAKAVAATKIEHEPRRKTSAKSRQKSKDVGAELPITQLTQRELRDHLSIDPKS